MIIKIEKRENPFAQIDRRVFEDARLSWRAKGILAYLLSKPADWWVRTEDIINHAKEGRDAVRVAMAELQEVGYAELVNTSSGREWRVYEQPTKPRPEKPAVDPSPEKPSVAYSGKPQPENPLLVIRKGSNKEEEETEELKLESSPAPKKKLKAGTVTGFKPNQDAIETFCESVGLPRSDGEIMLLKWNADGWPKNWQDKIRYWKRCGFMPSQKDGSKPEPSKPKPFVEDPDYHDFITDHPNEKIRCKFAFFKDAIKDRELMGEFDRWKKRGKYDRED